MSKAEADVHAALLLNSNLRHDFPFPRWVQIMRTTFALPSALKRFIGAVRTWISAVWRKELRPLS